MLNRNDPMTAIQRETLRGFYGEPIPQLGLGEAAAVIIAIKANNNERLTTEEIETLIGRELPS
jgi:hypothetical protein